MNRRWRSILYAAVGTALLIAFYAAPGVWATVGQNTLAQTVPTPTPQPGPVNSPEPPPQQSPAPAPDTPGSGQTPAPAGQATTVPAAAAGLNLTVIADRHDVVPGATVTFTLTVTNAGATALQDIVVEDVLPQGLEPGQVLSGGATWDGRTLRLTAPSLASGARLTVVYTTRVSASDPGAAILTRVTATAAGGVSKTATLALGLPPSELPVTGGSVLP